MRRSQKLPRPRASVLGLTLALLATPALAQEATQTIAWTDVGHSWSVWKWVGFAITVGVAWLVCSRLYFDRLIDFRREWPIWPRDAYARSIWLFLVAVTAAFVMWFRIALWNKRFRPSMLPLWGGVGSFLNDFWLLILIALAGLAVASIFHAYNKHTPSQQSPSRPGR